MVVLMRGYISMDFIDARLHFPEELAWLTLYELDETYVSICHAPHYKIQTI